MVSRLGETATTEDDAVVILTTAQMVATTSGRADPMAATLGVGNPTPVDTNMVREELSTAPLPICRLSLPRSLRGNHPLQAIQTLG